MAKRQTCKYVLYVCMKIDRKCLVSFIVLSIPCSIVEERTRGEAKGVRRKLAIATRYIMCLRKRY